MLLVAACGSPDHDPVLPGGSSGLKVNPSMALLQNIPNRCSSTTGYSFYKGCWYTGQQIDLNVDQQWVSLTNTAVGRWNFFLSQDSDAPTFAVQTVPGDVDVIITGGDGPEGWCGTYTAELDTVRLNTGDSPDCASSRKGNFRSAMLQETAGILGWSDDVEAHEGWFQPGLTYQCVLHIAKTSPGGLELNNDVCVQEAEGVVLAYRGLDGGAPGNNGFWRDSVYMHVRIKAPTGTIDVGDTVEIVADTFFSGGFGSGGGDGMDALVESRGSIPLAKPTNGDVIYSSSNSGVLSHLSGGDFKAVAQGSAYLRARPSQPPSTLTRWWLPFSERGDSVEITVEQAPPPPPPEYVVTTDQMPITDPGQHTFTAHIGSSNSTIYWEVDDSRTISIDPDTTFSTSGQQATFNVEAGSYSLLFQVSTSPSGPWEVQNIPVCTDAGQQFKDQGETGGNGTDAVGGCAPPPGGGDQ